MNRLSSACNVSRTASLAALKRQQGQVRHAGGFMKKHIRAEENAGLREISYKTWKFDQTSISRLAAYVFIPSFLFYSLVVSEFVSFLVLMLKSGLHPLVSFHPPFFIL